MGATAAKVKHVQVEKQLSRHNYSISHHMSSDARAFPAAASCQSVIEAFDSLE